MNFKFSKNQTVRAASVIEVLDGSDVYPDTRGTVKAHRADTDSNKYLVKFKGRVNLVQVREDQLSKV